MVRPDVELRVRDEVNGLIDKEIQNLKDAYERGEGGSLVATGSLAGEQGVPFNLAYASAKVRSAFVCTSPPSFGSSFLSNTT